MKRVAMLAVCIGIMTVFCGCGTKVLHCDNCGKEIKVSKDSNMDEDWIIFCSECEKDLGLDDIVPER